MFIGAKDYRLNLSKLAYGFRGGAPLDYLESLPASRVLELNQHLKTIADEVSSSG